MLLTPISHIGHFYFHKRSSHSTKSLYSCCFLFGIYFPWVSTGFILHLPLDFVKMSFFVKLTTLLKIYNFSIDTLYSHPLMYFSLHDISAFSTLFILIYFILPVSPTRCELHYTLGAFLHLQFQLLPLLPNLFCSGFP